MNIYAAWFDGVGHVEVGVVVPGDRPGITPEIHGVSPPPGHDEAAAGAINAMGQDEAEAAFVIGVWSGLYGFGRTSAAASAALVNAAPGYRARMEAEAFAAAREARPWGLDDLERTASSTSDPMKRIRPQAIARPKILRSDCAICGGAGVVFLRLAADGAPAADGPYSGTRPCACADLEAAATAYNRIGLPVEYARISVPGTDWDHPAARAMRRAVLGFIESWMPAARGMILCGPNGVGKGHLSALICTMIATRPRARLDGGPARRPIVRCIEWTALVDAVKTAFGGTPEEVVIAPYLDADLLWLDELGKGARTEWVDGLAERLLCRRLDLGRTTIVTSNLPPRAGMIAGWMGDDLAHHVGDRALSRLLGACTPYLMSGPDYRLEAKRG